MIDMRKELDDIKKYIWECRAMIGRDQFQKARNHIVPVAMACDTVAQITNHLSTDQLKELKELTEQTIDILRYIDER